MVKKEEEWEEEEELWEEFEWEDDDSW